MAYHQKALFIRSKLNNKELIAQSYNNLGYLYKDSRPDSAIYFLTKCLEIRKTGKDSSILVNTLQNLGYAWKKMGDSKRAFIYELRALKIAAVFHMKEEYAHAELDLAGLYITKRAYHQALKFIDSAEVIATTLHLPELFLEVYNDKYELYLQQKDYKDALFYADKKNIIKQSIISVAQDKNINELEIRYQTSQKEKDIAALNFQNKLKTKVLTQQQLLILILLIGAALLLLLFCLLYRSLKIKNRANKRINALMREIHHRTQNNLSIISGLFTMQMESVSDEHTRNILRENESRLLAMNLIHNKLFMESSSTLIDIQEYITNLLFHVKDAFNGSNGSVVELELHVDPVKLEADKVIAIGLIINELSTNAFKHAFSRGPGTITLSLSKKSEKKLMLVFSDNGTGPAKKNQNYGGSFGLKLVHLMARQLHSEIVSEQGAGTTYRMEFGV